MIKRIIICILLINNVITNNLTFSQDSLNFVIPKLYGFENIDADTFCNSQKLNPIYEALFQLENTPSKIAFFHIGDSHLQADYISHTIRTNLQKKFGNAGRGLISPLKVAKTNEPFNYLTQSSNTWKRQLIIAKKSTLPIGISGVTIQSKDTVGNITIKTFNTDSLDYSFNKITLFYHPDSAFSINIVDTNSIWTKNNTSKATFKSSQNTQIIDIQFQKKDSTQNNFTFFGCNLENDSSGIIYHSTGINGAKYADYNKPNQFVNQINLLNPKFIIISLGTNESFQPDFDTTRFYLTIDSLVKKINLVNPQSIILLTTPACSFKNYKKNTNLKLVTKTIVQYANKNQLPYWDLYELTGGENSAINWKKNLLLSRDGVHYSKNGYILQGQLFTLAFIKGYNQYVKHRLQ